jgi:hypothetical protein
LFAPGLGLVLALLLLWPTTLSAEAGPAGQGEASDSRALYLLPILDGVPSAERVRTVQESLGVGGRFLRVGFSGVFRYMADVEPGRDYAIVTTRLEEIATAARATQAPFLVHLNGGRWAGGGPLVEMLGQNLDAMAWDQLDRPWRYLVDGEYHFSLASGNQAVRRYKQRNLQAAAAWLADFKAGPDGHLLVGVSTDSEVLLNLHPWSDYNPLVQEEFLHWLRGDRLYDRGGRWATDGQGLSLSQLNARFGTSFDSWREVRPPREADDSRWWQAWTTFRQLLVDHNVQEQVDWIRAAGLPAEMIYSHQSPALKPEIFGDTLASAQVEGGRLGITLYGPQAVDRALLAEVRALSTSWGVFEYNAQGGDVATNLAALDLLRSFAPRIVCPYHWDDLGGPNEVGYTIRGAPLEEALRAFVELYADQPLPG